MAFAAVKVQLQQHKLKATPGRIRILEVLSASVKPLSVQGVLDKLGDAQIDQATVYRTLNTFHMLGIVRTVDFQHGHAHYELADRPHHHHLVCTDCGRVEDVRGCAIGADAKKVLKGSAFMSVEDHSLEFFGTCNACGGL